ncbi:mycofactocin-coupled SDR family oxidoreductase [Actinomadura madurae]|uniref:mycofactocin-coupled SDR family oxidoreductase n=1 Tax=Actinomadura madurae TaxID=1993 RepID=UPI0020271EBD|nr:mycofactocin-coupled SDR family oxidoreductase [Actinomadura madurae]MCQ0003979.1 mycofactocin-coupled SDR family oxidoreductase [Actinomadura madurae]URN00701.1 mycofactocin-coupled SDR family oxidoreductase [Actinomadura madurae]
MSAAGRPVAVVTGAARGIGAAVAGALASAGYDLVLGDVPSPGAVEGLGYPLATARDLAEVEESCRGLGAGVAALPCDVRSPSDTARLVDAADGRLVAAVAVAGIIGADGPAWELDPADLDRDLSVNLHGVANLARAAVPRLLRAPRGRGRFVAVVSSAGERGLPRLASYVAAKHAALGYVRALAADLGPSGVTANAVLPGGTATALLDRTAGVYGLSGAGELARHQRLGRLLDPAEIASAVVWLCSDGASATTGAALHVDGGFTG